MELATSQRLTDPMETTVRRIERIRWETRDTFTIDLEPDPGGPPEGFEPGQFNMIYCFGAGESAISISGDPANRSTLTHTIRAVGTVTRALAGLKRGDSVGVRGPYGTSWPVAAAAGNDILIIAGGIGLAPLRPAIYQVLSNRDDYGRVVLLYGARTPADLLFRQELEKWRGRFDMQVEVTVDNVRSDQQWRGNVGFVTMLIGGAQFDPTQTVAMLCGPELMMRFSMAELWKLGLGEEAVFLSMERNMKCGIGLCGHCQLGPEFVCRDGPVFRYDRIRDWLRKREA